MKKPKRHTELTLWSIALGMFIAWCLADLADQKWIGVFIDALVAIVLGATVQYTWFRVDDTVDTED